jgi:hypothetical protein
LAIFFATDKVSNDNDDLSVSQTSTAALKSRYRHACFVILAVNSCCRVQTTSTARMHPLPCELCVFALNQRKQRLYVEPIHPKARHIPRKAARLRARCAGFRSSPRRNRRRPLGAPPTGSAGFPAGQLGAPPTGSAGFPAGQLGAPAFQPANWERRLSSRPTGSAGFPAGHWERRLSSRPLGAPAFQPANWERRLSSRLHLMRARCPHQVILQPKRFCTFPPVCSARMDLARVQGFSRFPTSLARH